MKKVITIGREFGSGGRAIGRRIAEKLQIAYYDQEIVTEIAKRTKLSEEYVERITEDRPYMAYPVHAGMSFHTAYYAYTEFDRSLTVVAEQHNIIKELADKSDCIIVGRCADYILRDNPDCISFFIQNRPDVRIKRIVESMHISEEEAKSLMEKRDKARAAYYNYYTNKVWGASASYDLSINASILGIDATVSFIKDFVEQKYK